MIKLAICDDTELQVELLLDLLSDYQTKSGKQLDIHTYSSGEELLAAREKEGGFDIYMLDILMGNLNGIETAKALRLQKDKGKLLFLTSSPDYVFAAFSVKAANYLLKPLDPKQLFSELDLLIQEIEQEHPPVILLKTTKGDQRILVDDIIYIDYLNRRPVFHLRNHMIVEGFSQRQRFQDYLAEVLNDSRFSRCHISIAVNLKHVISLKRNQLTLDDGTELQCTRTMRQSFREALQNFQEHLSP